MLKGSALSFSIGALALIATIGLAGAQNYSGASNQSNARQSQSKPYQRNNGYWENGIYYENDSMASPMSYETEAVLRSAMRNAWDDHVSITREFVIAATHDQPTSSILDRLMQNQEAIGDVVRPYYGDDVGDRLTSLLKEHISIAGEVVAAAKASDQTKLADSNRRWYDNADEIARYTHRTGLHYGSESNMKDMMHEHLKLLTDETLAEIKGDSVASHEAYMKSLSQARLMADAWTDGVVKHETKYSYRRVKATRYWRDPAINTSVWPMDWH